MKRFWKNLLEWKTAAVLMFSGTVILYSTIAFILGGTLIPLDVIWAWLILSSVGGLLQLLMFSEQIVKKRRYSVRVIIFLVSVLMLSAVTALVFLVFDIFSMNWELVLGIFFTVFVIMTIGLEIYYRLMGKKYNALLSQYRKQRDLNQREKL